MSLQNSFMARDGGASRDHHVAGFTLTFHPVEHPAASPSADAIDRQLRAGQQLPAGDPASCRLQFERSAVLSLGRSARGPMAPLSSTRPEGLRVERYTDAIPEAKASGRT